MNIREAREFLGVTASSSEAEIRKKYHELAKLYHPDTGAAGADHAKFVKLKQAYDLCMQPPKQGPAPHAFKPSPSPEQNKYNREFMEEALRGFEKAAFGKKKPAASSNEEKYTDINVYVSAKDLFCGATIEHTFDRSIFVKSKRATVQESVTLTIPRRCGFTRHVFLFRGLGKQIAAYKPDAETLRVSVRLKADAQWRVYEHAPDSLIANVTIHFEQFILADAIRVPLPDGSTASIAMPLASAAHKLQDYNGPASGVYVNVKIDIDWATWRPKLRPFVVEHKEDVEMSK